MRTAKQLIYTHDFPEIGSKDVDGFVTTADAYRALLAQGELEYELRSLISDFDHEDEEELKRRGHAARIAVLDMPLPKETRDAVIAAYERLCKRLGYEPELAVTSSATAEGLPEGSLTGAETLLIVHGRAALLRALHICYASLFTDRAISSLARLNYDHLKVAISVNVHPMVPSDSPRVADLYRKESINETSSPDQNGHRLDGGRCGLRARPKEKSCRKSNNEAGRDSWIRESGLRAGAPGLR
jgi:phosphoenolpyruvate synthase/pyruvate phosphate dikinase